MFWVNSNPYIFCFELVVIVILSTQRPQAKRLCERFFGREDIVVKENPSLSSRLPLPLKPQPRFFYQIRSTFSKAQGIHLPTLRINFIYFLYIRHALFRVVTEQRIKFGLTPELFFCSPLSTSDIYS